MEAIVSFALGLNALHFAYYNVNRNLCKTKLYKNTKTAKQTNERKTKIASVDFN